MVRELLSCGATIWALAVAPVSIHDAPVNITANNLFTIALWLFIECPEINCPDSKRCVEYKVEDEAGQIDNQEERPSSGQDSESSSSLGSLKQLATRWYPESERLQISLIGQTVGPRGSRDCCNRTQQLNLQRSGRSARNFVLHCEESLILRSYVSDHI